MTNFVNSLCFSRALNRVFDTCEFRKHFSIPTDLNRVAQRIAASAILERFFPLTPISHRRCRWRRWPQSSLSPLSSETSPLLHRKISTTFSGRRPTVCALRSLFPPAIPAPRSRYILPSLDSLILELFVRIQKFITNWGNWVISVN